MTKKIVALLPIKANSERVKGKNFRNFNGKPLFRWVLDSLLLIDQIDEVIINTDARSVLAKHGLVESKRVKIRDRKKAICGDEVSMNEIIADDIEHVKADIYLMTHTTNPLLTSNSILNAISRFQKENKANHADSLFTVNKVQSRFYKKNGLAINHDPDHLIPTQELEPWYEENSNLYIFTKDSFAETQARIGVKPILFETPSLESIDIDTEDDWRLALSNYISINVRDDLC
jgi:CMP-N-acetylneuraminic acid synthetase